MHYIPVIIAYFLLSFLLYPNDLHAGTCETTELRKRPKAQLFEQQVSTRHFRLHYTLEGAHQLFGTKADSLTVNRYIAYVKYYLEAAHIKLIQERQFLPPIKDGTLGGGQDLYDVYFMKMPLNVSGVTYSDPEEQTSEQGAITYMVLSSRLELTDIYGGNPIAATVTHEFFHMIQNAYYGSELASMPGQRIKVARSTSIREGTAVWAETLVYQSEGHAYEGDSVNTNYFSYLNKKPGLFSQPEKHLLVNEEATASQYAYTTVFFWKYLSEQFGDDIIRQLWERLSESYGSASTQQEIDALNEILLPHGGLPEIYGHYLATVFMLKKEKKQYKYYSDRYPKLAYEQGLQYLHFIKQSDFTPMLSSREKAITTDWNCSRETGKGNCNLKAAGGAAYHALSFGEGCAFELQIKPPKASYNIQNTDLYAILLKENTKTGKIELDFATFDTQNNCTSLEVYNVDADKLTLMVYRLTDPQKAAKLGTATLRYDIVLKPLEYDCSN